MISDAGVSICKQDIGTSAYIGESSDKRIKIGQEETSLSGTKAGS